MKETNRKSRPALTVVAMMGATVIAKLLGMLRSVIMASVYGTGAEAEAFSAASHIPLTFFDLAFGAAILGCFIPVYNSFAGDTDGAKRFGDVFLSTVIAASGLLALLGMIFADVIISLMIPGASDGVRETAAQLLRIMFPMVIFTGSTYTLIGIMQSEGRYFLPAVVSAVSNGAAVAYLLFIDGKLGEKGIYGLAVTYLIGWLLQLMTMAVPMMISGKRFRFALDFRNAALIRALKMTPQVMFGSWLTPISVQLGLFFASFITVSGSVTMFDYSYAAFALIAGILTYSICNYVFPLLSRAEGEEWCSMVRIGLKAAAALILPFTAVCILLPREIVAVLFMRKSFGVESAAGTSVMLRMMSIALPAFTVNEIMSRVFYSRGESRPAAAAALVGICANVVFSAVCVFGFGTVGSAAVGYTAGIAASAVTLIIFIQKKVPGLFDFSLLCDIMKITAAALISALAMALVYRFAASDTFGSSMWRNIFTCAAVFLPGVLVYAVCLKFTGVKFKQ